MRILLFVLGVIGLCFAALDIPDHLRTPVMHLRRACLAESGVDEKYVNQSRNGYLPDVPELRCYILCVMEHAGLIEANGTIHFNEIMHLLPQSNAESVIYVSNECKTIYGANRCETAYLTLKCFFEKAPEGAELP